MSTAFYHRHDHAVIVFADTLQWTPALELVDTLDTLVELYFYALVELVVSSPGGEVRALRYVLDAMEAHRAQGVRIRTRVLSHAESAAAVLVCLGDERIAEPDARLLFHASRALDIASITASGASTLRHGLARTDDALVALLVERAMRGVDAERALEAEPLDRAALGELAPALARPARRRHRGLARALGAHVTRAVESGDRAALTRLYRRLLRTEHALSPSLALTLGLIDHVGRRAPERPGSEEPTGLAIPEWRVLYPPDGDVPRASLTRHTLILGETGAGKTASAILPVVAAMARAPRERLCAALIIDPKRELAPALQSLAPQRLRHLHADTVALDLMAGPRHALHADLAARRFVSAATKMLARIASFVPSNPARTLFATMGHDAGDVFFDKEGAALALSVLGLVLILTAPDAPAPETWLARDGEARAWAEALRRRARGTDSERGPNALALTAWALDSVLVAPIAPGITVWPSDDGAPSGWLFARIARAALETLGDARCEAHDLLERILTYWPSMMHADKQFAGVRASAATVCAELAAPAVARTLYFGCEPGYLDADAAGIDFARIVAPAGDDAPLVLFQPSRDGLDTLVAVALKALFFEAVLDDDARIRAGPDLPLVGYVADEAHRFLTSDPLHGEQSFLDTCRSFGAMCVLACQSLASIEHALAHRGGTPAQNDSAVSILWNNTASKLVFRSTDPHTAERVSELCPLRPGIAGVTRVRPVSALATGECYAILADGRFERRRLHPFTPHQPAPQRIESTGRSPHDPTRHR